MSYLCYLCLFGSSLPQTVVCRRADVLFMLFVFVWFLQLFVGGLMSYLCYLCLFGSVFTYKQLFVGGLMS